MFWSRRKKEENEVQDEEATSRAGHAIPTQQTGAPSSVPPTAADSSASHPAAESPAAEGPSAEQAEDAMVIRSRIIAVLKTVYDPEIPVDIYELGLIYGLEVSDDGDAHVTMTLTTPMCPVAETLPPEIEEKVRNVKGVRDVSLDLVWDPPWSIDMMSDAARLELNLM